VFVEPRSQKQLQNKVEKRAVLNVNQVIQLKQGRCSIAVVGIKKNHTASSLCDIFICTFRVEKYVSVDQGEFKDGSNPPRFEKFLKLLLNFLCTFTKYWLPKIKIIYYMLLPSTQAR
jgi:hypothetical protein